MADQKAGPMGEIAARVLRDVMRAEIHGENMDPIIERALAAAYAAGREKGIEEAAALFDEDAREGEELIKHRDPEWDIEEIKHYRNVMRMSNADASRIRALAAQPPPPLAQPSATRKEE